MHAIIALSKRNVLFIIIKYEFNHGTEAKCSDNRGVRIIEVQIIEVGLYVCGKGVA